MYRCPECSNAEELRVVARITVVLNQDDPDNIETEEARNCGGHDWDDQSLMWCPKCNHTEMSAEFEE